MSSMLPLSLQEYERYGRQMILDGFGLAGQLKLRNSSAVVVGAGGLGCPVLQYLAAAGVGRLGIVDDDSVELSNLSRQILHTESSLGLCKAKSAADSIRRLNSAIQVDVIASRLTAKNALSILGSYDIILDCTDNAPTRYLLSDVAVVLNKPLVSGAAQKYEGQLCIYNLGPSGPCYRCLFPSPPAQEVMNTCEETGVLGAVTGIIGNMQALETIKLLLGLHDETPSLLLFSALCYPAFRTIKLRSRRANCIVCGRRDLKSVGETDYVQLCGGPKPDWRQRGLVSGSRRVSAKELKKLLDSGKSINLLDVRPSVEFGICHLPSSQSVPLHELIAKPEDYLPQDPKITTYVICRLGNDSQIAAEALRSICFDSDKVRDVIGGLRAWSQVVDNEFPIY